MSRDLRRYAEQTTTRLILGGLLLLFIVGGGLIYAFYGEQAALTGLICLMLSTAPLFLIWFFLWGMEWLVNRSK